MRHLNHVTDDDQPVPTFNLGKYLRSEIGFIKLAYRRNPQAVIASVSLPFVLLIAVLLNCHS
jgi:hypothetical protein